MRALGLILALCGAEYAYGKACKVDAGFRGSRFHVYYEQRHLVTVSHRWKSLPRSVKSKLKEQLEARLGRQFAKRLQIDEIQTLDLGKLQREFPALYDQNRKLGTYDLLFRFSDRSIGLKYFYTKLFANADGSVNEQIRLPNIAADLQMANLISCEAAVQKGVDEGFPREDTSPDFGYSSECDCFVWVLTSGKAIAQTSLVGKGTYKKIDIDANTGRVLRRYTETIII